MTITNYTTRTRLAKPDLGHQNWDTDFAAIMNMVDEIEGYSSVDVTASGVALSTNNNATDQSRPRLVVVFGTPGVLRVVTVPNVSRHFFVLNISNASCRIEAGAGTSVTIAAGDLWLIRTDGATNAIGYQIGGASTGTGAYVRTNTPTITDLTIAGALVVNGGLIRFPAVQVPSGGANDLDDYEESTWTPVLTFATTAGSTTYNNRAGWATKVGNRVDMWFNMEVAGVTGTGIAKIQGWPVAPGGNVAGALGISQFANNLLGTPVTGLHQVLHSGQTESYLRIGDNANNLTHANMNSGLGLIGSFTIFV